MKLYTNKASPFARKVRVLVRETGLAGRVEEAETVVSPIAANETLARDNPLVKIPAPRAEVSSYHLSLITYHPSRSSQRASAPNKKPAVQRASSLPARD